MYGEMSARWTQDAIEFQAAVEQSELMSAL